MSTTYRMGLWYSFGRAVSRRFQGCQEQHSQLEGNQRNIAISPDYSQFWTQTSDTTVVDLFHKLDTHTVEVLHVWLSTVIRTGCFLHGGSH